MFGLALSRSGAADYNYIRAMFLLQNFQLYGIIGSAVVFTAPALYLLKRYGRIDQRRAHHHRPEAHESRDGRRGPPLRRGLVDHRDVPGTDHRQRGRRQGNALAALAGDLPARRPSARRTPAREAVRAATAAEHARGAECTSRGGARLEVDAATPYRSWLARALDRSALRQAQGERMRGSG
ncbi:MAG: hypothetical protein U0360_08365 [Dehalococcoidia bacterium]